MAEVKTNDLVFSYAGGAIRAIGTAERAYVPSARPEGFGKAGERWAATGWLVPVRWSLLQKPVKPRDHLKSIAPLLPAKYSPIRPTGIGNQKFYLTAISRELAQLLLNISRRENNVCVDLFEDLQDELLDEQEENLLRDQDLPPVEKAQLIKARRGQGLFRSNLEKIEHKCRVTGVADKRFLIASHIKPWRTSTNREKLDGSNGLFLSPHLDKLFDRGWISFSDDGRILCASEGVKQLLLQWGIDPDKAVGSFRPSQTVYLSHHRSTIFKPSLATLP